MSWGPGVSHDMMDFGGQALDHLRKSMADNPGALKIIKPSAAGRLDTMCFMMQEIQSSLA